MNTHDRIGDAWRGSRRAGGNSEAADADIRTVASEALFRGSREIAIEHNGARYLLKITRQGKLILNK